MVVRRTFINFWREAATLSGSISPRVLPQVLVFGSFAALIYVIAEIFAIRFQAKIRLPVDLFEIAGGVLGVLLVLRTNAGHDRWWEARGLWGGIVNQTRNLVVMGLCYGPKDPDWRRSLVGWTAAFPYVACASLRGEPLGPRVAELVGAESAERIAAAEHMPSFVVARLAALLRDATDRLGMDNFAFLQADRERARLLDHVGACEKILKTPLPFVYANKIRQFLSLFLFVLPFGLLNKIDNDWTVPLITMLVAYPLIALDQIGVELQNPFAVDNLSHLPLGEIVATIDRNLNGLLAGENEWGTGGGPVVGAPEEPRISRRSA
jgi:putative membrane protein